MTIITKSGQEKNENEANKIKAAAFGVEIPVDGQPPAGRSVAWAEDQQPSLDWYVAWRRRRLLSSLCAGLLVLWILLASVIGGILLFRYIHRRPVFYGWCGTRYDDGMYGGSRFEKLQERVEVDPTEEYEKIEVPKFGPNRPAVFVHDFRQNLTAIVDVVGYQCFLKSLDRSQVSPPENFIDLISKMESGYYEQNTRVVREKYRVVFPPLTDLDLRDTGSWMIVEQCQGSITFRLQRDWTDEILERPQVDDPVLEDGSTRQKRNADAGGVSRLGSVGSFRYFSGKEIVILDIVS